MRTVRFAADMAGLEKTNMNYWFNGLTAVTSVEGMANLANVDEMRYTFNACTGITELDLCGFDPSSLTMLTNTFSGCTKLATIYADPTWALPADCGGGNTFYNCTSLVGGNGTRYMSSMVNWNYMRIDAEGANGYLTARE